MAVGKVAIEKMVAGRLAETKTAPLEHSRTDTYVSALLDQFTKKRLERPGITLTART